jgi:RNA polymerase sigma factor (sigma-70 family)
MSDASDRPGAGPGLRVVAGDPGAPYDDALLCAFLAGDDEAFGELVRRHERAVLRVVRRYARNAGDERDLAQRAFLKAFQAVRHGRWLGRGAVPFRAWLFRIAVNLGRNHLRDSLRWRQAPAAVAERIAVAPVGAAALERAERERAVREAVLLLPRRQREVLTLRVDAELSFREIAEALGMTELNARVHFHHAARRLRDAVAGGEKP